MLVREGGRHLVRGEECVDEGREVCGEGWEGSVGDGREVCGEGVLVRGGRCVGEGSEVCW